MEFQMESDQWGGYISPETFEYSKKLKNKDLGENTIVLRKSKEFIEDIDRDIVKTEYFVLMGNKFKQQNKNWIKSLMAEFAIEYIDEHKCLPPKTNIKKTYKTSVRLLYVVDKYDSFEMTIKKDMIGNKSLDDYFNGLQYVKSSSPKSVKGDGKSWEVKGSKGKVYVVKKIGDKWTCTCPSFIYRGGQCKHIIAKQAEV